MPFAILNSGIASLTEILLQRLATCCSQIEASFHSFSPSYQLHDPCPQTSTSSQELDHSSLQEIKVGIA